MKKLYAICIPALAVLAFAAVPAGASAATLILQKAGGGALAKGTKVEGFSSNLVFTTSEMGGALNCTESKVSGTVTQNEATTVIVSVTAATFTGASGGLCETTTALGKVEIKPSGLPWTITFEAKEKTKITSATEIDFEAISPTTKQKCIYGTTEAIHDSYVLNTSPLIDTITTNKFTRQSGSASICPLTGELTSGAFKLTSEGAALEIT